jgi:hypothetical protein
VYAALIVCERVMSCDEPQQSVPASPSVILLSDLRKCVLASAAEQTRTFNVALFEISIDGILPSTNDVSKVTVAALRRPAGKFTPILSSRSRNARPPFLDLALFEKHKSNCFFEDEYAHVIYIENVRV